jgi:hypothetical protein
MIFYVMIFLIDKNGFFTTFALKFIQVHYFFDWVVNYHVFMIEFGIKVNEVSFSYVIKVSLSF